MMPCQENESKNPFDFVHLHIHSEYSLVDGAIRISELVQNAVDSGHKAIALTGHGKMHGAVEFYSKCMDAGIKPILGCEIYHEGLPETAALCGDDEARHMVLLARTTAGYHSLMRLVSYGYLRGENENIPVVPAKDLDEGSEDLIMLSSCLKGEWAVLVGHLVRINPDPVAELKNPGPEGKPVCDALRLWVERMQQRFGAGNVYIELIDNNLPAQKTLLPHLAAVAGYFSLPLVATCDAHYLKDDFRDAHAVLTAIKNDLTTSHIRHRRRDARFHVFSNEEMQDTYGPYEEALRNTGRIADRCEVTIEFGKFFLPDFDLQGEDINDALRRLSREGLQERLSFIRKSGREPTEGELKEYDRRLDYELDVIINMGFPGYFLIVQDFINWAKDHDIPVGPGRGSGAGSLVAWALRITDLDPIPLNLIFERFLNPERISMPDFDVDFCQSRRDEVIQYVSRKYGTDNVAQITTFGKMKAKAALRDVGRVLEMSYPRVDRIAKLVPNELDITLESALAQEPRLMEEAGQDDVVDEMIRTALQIEGLSRHTSVHAAGVVISNGAMENFVPVYKGEDGSLITQYEMKNAEKVGLVKFDFLGLKTLTVIQKAVNIIRSRKNKDFRIEDINLEDPLVYAEISTGNTCGIFQLESSGMQTLNMKLKPSCFEDIIAVVALFRPGPLGSGMVDDFIERKHGRQEIDYPLPQLEPILADTYGIILYQEQVQKIAATLASYSLGEADILRRAMGKKKPEEMAKQKTRFLKGAAENSVDEKIADEIFELMAKFAAYGFNKSHSAAYGLVSYQTAFLKTHFPEEFMAAIMTCDLDNSDKLYRYIEECRRLRFAVLQPDINQSELEFNVPAPKKIGYALAAIKGIGAASLVPLIENREKQGPYLNLTDMAMRVNLHLVGKKTLELLTEAGALDCFSKDRCSLMSAIPDLVKFSENHHNARRTGQALLFDQAEEAATGGIDPADYVSRPLEKYRVLTALDWLAKERKLLGVFLSGHPLHIFKQDASRFGKMRLGDLPKLVGQKNVPLVALVLGTSERLTKSGKRMAYVMLEDLTGSREAVMFENELPDQMPKDGSLVVAWCSISKSFDGSSLNLRLESLSLLEDVRREMIRQSVIEIKASTTEAGRDPVKVRQVMQKVNSLLRANEGRTAVRIHLCYDKLGEVVIEPGIAGINLNNLLFQNLRSMENQGARLLY